MDVAYRPLRDADADDDARRPRSRSRSPPGGRASRLRRARAERRTCCRAEPRRLDRRPRVRWVTLVSIAVGGLLLGATAAVLGRTDIGLQMRAAAIDARTARLLGVRAVDGHPLRVRAGRDPGRLGDGPAHRPAARSSRRATASSSSIPALVGVVVGGIDRLVERDARRLRDRLRRRRARRRPPGRRARLPRHRALPARHPRPARAPERALHPLARGRGSGCEARCRRLAAARAGPALVVLVGVLGQLHVALGAVPVPLRPRDGDDRDRALRLRRELRGRLVRPHQLRGGRGLRRRR